MDAQTDRRRLPNADDIALAIVLAARAYNEDPIAVAMGEVVGIKCRPAAFCALEICFPQAPKYLLSRLIGAPKAFCATFERFRDKEQKKFRRRVQWQIVAALDRQLGSSNQFGHMHDSGEPESEEITPEVVPAGDDSSADTDTDNERPIIPAWNVDGFGPIAEAVAGLDNETCRWPIGDVRELGFRFCGKREADLAGKQPYCHEHRPKPGPRRGRPPAWLKER